MGLLGGFVLYICYAICFYKIAVKLGSSDIAIFAFFPILNIYLPLKLAGFSGFWLLIYFLNLFSGVFGLAIGIVSVIITVIVHMHLAYYCGFNKYYGLLILVPFVNLLFLFFIAFSDREPIMSMEYY